jgi:hypothetical protein
VHSEHDRDRTVERLLRQSLKPRADSAPPGPCLEADALAAWADGALAADELAAAEAHVSDCSRCQALLAALIRSAPGEPVAEPWWRRRWALGVLVPVAAAAAALVLWTVVPRNDQRGSIDHPPAQANVNPPSSPAAQEPQREETRALSQPAPPASRLADAKPQTRADESRVKARKADPARELDRVSSPTEIAAQPATVPRAAVPPPPPTRAMTANAGERSRDSAAALMEKAPVFEIASPDRSNRWRLGPPGSVEYSNDGGSTWQTLSTGVSAGLTAGASPSSSVCWLVGRSGTVVLTTDGRRFQRVAFPEGVDLIAVSAVDARIATVTTADGRRFSTADGGLTWRQS